MLQVRIERDSLNYSHRRLFETIKGRRSVTSVKEVFSGLEFGGYSRILSAPAHSRQWLRSAPPNCHRALRTPAIKGAIHRTVAPD